MNAHFVVSLIGAAAAAASAVCWIISARIEVPNNIDTFIGLLLEAVGQNR
jgi:hypothetical protein